MLVGGRLQAVFFPTPSNVGKKFVCQDARGAAIVTEAIRCGCRGVLDIAHPYHRLDRFTTM